MKALLLLTISLVVLTQNSALANTVTIGKSDDPNSTNAFFTGKSYIDQAPIVRPVLVQGLMLTLSWWQAVRGEDSVDNCLLGKITYGAMSEMLAGYIRLDDVRLSQRIAPLLIEAIEEKCKIDLSYYKTMP